MERFQRGYKQGWWTEAMIEEAGCSDPKELLAEQERIYEAESHGLSPEQAEEHAEFMRGFIAGARESLQKLIEAREQRH